MTSTILSRECVEAFTDDEDDFDPRYCVGNSHLLIEHYYSATSARCACGSTVIRKTDDTWTHRSHGAMGRACPPYDCACGQRHNVRAA